MKSIEKIEDAIVELFTLKPSKHRKMAVEHLKKAIVQIGIHVRQNKILEDRKKEKDEQS